MKIICIKSLLSILVFTVIFAYPFITYAQGSDGEKEIIYLKVNNASSGFYKPATNSYSGGTFPSYSFRIGEDGKSNSVGFTGSALRPYLEGNPEALAELDRFKKKRNGMLTGIGIFVAGGALTAIIGVNEGTGEFTRDFQTGEMVEKQKIKPGGILGIGVMLTGIIVTGVNGSGATKHVVKAVEIYNEGISPTSTSLLNIKIAPEINPSMIGAGFKFSW